MTRKRAKRAKRGVVSKLAHPVARWLSLLHHRHSGQLVHRKHTSHAALTILLVITGFFVFISYDISSADTITKSGNVAISSEVPGPAPASGAVITNPLDGKVFKYPIIHIGGTCNRNTTVVIYSNSTLAGSTLCNDMSLRFSLQVQLFAGMNSLTALNYDTLNQAGPITPIVKVKYDAPVPHESPGSPVHPLPIHPVIVPGVTPKPPASCETDNTPLACNLEYLDTNTCNGYVYDENLPVSDSVRVAVLCQPRYINILDVVAIGILVWGGQPPYDIDIDWGGDAIAAADVTRKITKPGYYVVTASYNVEGNFDVQIEVTDKNGKKAQAQAGINVPGKSVATAHPANFGEYISNSLTTSWFDTPVPTYLLAVAIVLGFWAGDYFERAIHNAHQMIKKPRKKNRKRHA